MDRSLLIIDDDEDLSFIISDMLEGYGYSVEMVDAPWTVGENQFQGVRMHVIDEYGVWSAEYYGYCSKEGISMFVEIYNVPDDGAIDAVLNCFQPLEIAG